jgi:hypothetical protein
MRPQERLDIALLVIAAASIIGTVMYLVSLFGGK